MTEGDLYEALVHVNTGGLHPTQVLDAYLRATMVAAGIEVETNGLDCFDEIMQVFEHYGSQAADLWQHRCIQHLDP